MITKLTTEQEARFPYYVDKWIKIGLSTKRANREISEQAIKNLYKLANLKEPEIIWCPCPISGALAALIIGSIRKKEGKDHSAVYSEIGSAVDSAVAAAGSAADSAVSSAVRSAVGSAVYSAVDSAVGSAVDSAVRSAVRSAAGSKIKFNEANGMSYIGGSLWSGYSAWADFFNVECGIKIDRNYLDIVENCGYYFCLEGICIATERATEINLLNGRLHKDGGMSIKYESGWGLYHLNGVKVQRELSETPAEKLSLDFFEKEKNADVKAEFIRKYGIERMSSKGKLVDSYKKYSNEWFGKSEYELIDMSPVFTRLTYAPYLKMKNQTVPGVFHLEAIPRTIKTVQEAVNFRTKSKNPTIVNIK